MIKNFLINFFKLLSLLLIFWILLRTISPIKPSPIPSNFVLCHLEDISSWVHVQGKPADEVTAVKNDFHKSINFYFDKPGQRIIYICRTSVPVTTLYKAKTLNITVNSNQPVNLDIELQRKGSGGEIKKFSIEEKQVGVDTKFSENLGSDIRPKINWMTGDYDTVMFYISPTHTDNLNLTIKDIYLK